MTENPRFREMPYDLVKEMTIAITIIGVLVLALAFALSTPDVTTLTAKQVASQDPLLVVNTALRDLNKTSRIATYGPPYNDNDDASAIQSIGPIAPQSWAGVQIPINTAKVDVLDPLSHLAVLRPGVKGLLATYEKASSTQRHTWLKAMVAAMPKAKIVSGHLVLPASGSYGPVPQMLSDYLTLAKSGLLEAAIDGTGPQPNLNRTKSLLLFQGKADHLMAAQLDMTGEEWGIIKETGNYPGAVWLGIYTFLYQIPPISTSPSIDLLAVALFTTMVVIAALLPFIPGLRDIPKAIPVYKWIWRDFYREEKERQGRSSS